MQYQQLSDTDLYRTVKRILSLLILLAAVPSLAYGSGVEQAPAPLQRRDPEMGVLIGEPLRSVATSVSLVMDGRLEAAWYQAPVLEAPLHYGLHGQEPAGTVELRSLHDDEHLYLLARWLAPAPSGKGDVWRNLATVHWRLVDSGQVSGQSTASEGLACTVGCHTVTADGQGGLVGIRTETIPLGLSENLPAGGGWSAGEWLLEWSRPRTSDNPYDQNLVDPSVPYLFFVKLFLGLEGQPDPTTDIHELRLTR